MEGETSRRTEELSLSSEIRGRSGEKRVDQEGNGENGKRRSKHDNNKDRKHRDDRDRDRDFDRDRYSNNSRPNYPRVSSDSRGRNGILGRDSRGSREDLRDMNRSDRDYSGRDRDREARDSRNHSSSKRDRRGDVGRIREYDRWEAERPYEREEGEASPIRDVNSKKRKLEEPVVVPVVEVEEAKPLTESDIEKLRQERAERWKRLRTESALSMQASGGVPQSPTETTTTTVTIPSDTVTTGEEVAEDPAPSDLAFDEKELEKPNSEKSPDKEDSDDESGPDLFGDDDVEFEETSIKAFTRVEVEASDDHEGYYSFRLGEILGGKYVVVGYHGQGVFSNVLKCTEVGTDKEVAIKLLRNNEHMKRTGKKEVRILRQLRDSDLEGKANNIRLLNDFEDRDHLCLVFEPMDCNLRQLLKKCGGRGISIVAVRFYASKLLRALIQLYNQGIIHADFKPDNILVTKDRTQVKLADLGSALELSEVEMTPFLVSRFYRAPEIILGLPYNQAIDMFAFGTCLYELATGKPLLKSRDNNHHLKLIQAIKGPVPKRLIQKARFKEYFDETGAYFLETLADPVDKSKEIVRKIRMEKASRDITQELLASYNTSNPKEKKLISLLGDLIERCVEIDETRRLSPQQASKHELFRVVA